MRRFFKLTLCLICFLIYFLVSLVVSAFLIFSKQSRKRYHISKLIHLFALCLIRIINVRISIRRPKSLAPLENFMYHKGNSPAWLATNGRGAFLVSNHLGYVDGLLLGSLFPVVYVSKSELKKWPLIGLMTEVSGTFFIDRLRKNHLSGYVDDIARTLEDGVNILFFPEGTSTNGEELLVFKSAFFEAPLRVNAPVIPVSIVYKSVDGVALDKNNRDFVYWYGDMTFVDHFLTLLSCRRLEVEVTIHPVLPIPETGEQASRRKQISESAYAAIFKDIKLIHR